MNEIRRCIEKFLLQQTGDDAVQVALLLETLRDILLALSPIESNALPETLLIRLRCATLQALRGLMYHLGSDSKLSEQLREMANQVEQNEAELQAGLAERNALRRRLKIQDSDIATLHEELEVLRNIEQYEKCRQTIQARCVDRKAYQEALRDAATRAPSEMARLEQLADSVEDLLSQQRDLLCKEYEAQQAAWQRVEREVFES